VAMVVCLSSALAQGPVFDDWIRCRDNLAQNPDVARYYTFEEAETAQTPIPSLVGEPEPLTYGVMGEASDEERDVLTVHGRFMEKKAVRLDRGIFSAPQFAVTNGGFSVEAWVRTHGQGALQGDRPEQSATLLSQGNGYWDGWRITLSYPTATYGFELGKQPGSFGIRAASPAPDGVWHHLVATWDSETVCLYVDGVQAASGIYAGDYAPPAPDGVFRLGYADAGWGAAIADYDEVVIYRRALNPLEVLQRTLYYAPLNAAHAEALGDAEEAAAEGNAAEATRACEQLLAVAGLHAHWAAMVRLRLADTAMEGHNYPRAISEYTTVLRTPDLPEGLRTTALGPVVQLALQSGELPPSLFELVTSQGATLSPAQQMQLQLNLARSYTRAGKQAEAQRVYERVLAMTDLKDREKLEVLLQAGHGLVADGQYEAARAQYRRIVDTAETPAQYRSYALLCMGRTYVMQKQYAVARKAYERLEAMAEAPAVHLWEAAEGKREAERLSRGLPARDPAAYRVQLPKLPAPGVRLFVSPSGDDASPGTKDHPFATLQRAQVAVRALVAEGLPRGGLVVSIGAGEYRLSEGVKFGAEDSGTAAAPVVWRAQERGRVILTGGQAVPELQPVTDEAILARLPEETRDKVMMADLRAAGITQYGELKPRGFSHGGGTPALELFRSGVPLTPARWPNESFARAKRVVSNDEQGAVFEYDDDRPARWQQAKDPWVFGYWKWQWADSRDPVLGLDTTARTVHIPQVTYGGFDAGAPYFIYNLLEEIDQPGEWYLDREAGLLYLYPLPGDEAPDLRVSLASDPLVSMDGAAWVRLEGLTLEYGQWHGVSIKDGEHCLVAGCTIRNLSGDAVVIDGGKSHGIYGCDLYNLGRGGSVITGGDRKTLEPGRHFIANCDVHHFSRVDRTYTPAVLMNGVGNRIAHNRFHHTPCHAMRIEGNDHVIEFNEIHDVVTESDDQGGLDMWGNAGYRGVILRYNFWHDIGTPYTIVHGQAGIRLDDAICEVLIYGNIFTRCSNNAFGAIQIHGGKENLVVNNVFADCKYALSFSGWGADGWKRFLESDFAKTRLYEEVDVTQPPYSTKYPLLGQLEANEGSNQVWSNVAYNCGEFLTRDRGIQDLMDNTITLQNPGFVDTGKLDFRLRPESPLLHMPGFRPIPVDEIGLYEDPLRASRP
jgi:tetratricopeptide (TPR) repeat protein